VQTVALRKRRFALPAYLPFSFCCVSQKSPYAANAERFVGAKRIWRRTVRHANLVRYAIGICFDALRDARHHAIFEQRKTATITITNFVVPIKNALKLSVITLHHYLPHMAP
jgi:hypothetical protein